MKLYYSKGACSLAVRIIINELGLSSEYVAVDLKTKQTEDGKDFNQINPKGSVPALDVGNNEVLTENAAIQQYLADKEKNYELLPELNDFKRYRVLEWLNYVTTELHKGFAPLFNPKYPQEVKDEFIIPALKSKLNFVNEHLAKDKYLVGDNFTLPDGYLFVILLWTRIIKLNLNEWPNIEKYFNELKARPSIHKSLEQEGLVK